jgi:lipoate-protein ligase B
MALVIQDLGRVAYGEALERQRAAVEARRAGRAPDVLLLLEHPPVVTLGRSAREENLRQPRSALARRGVEVHEVARGGDVTYHAPGQLVGYPILDLSARDARDVHAYLRGLETALCEALDRLGVRPRLLPGYTGVFVEPGLGEPEDPPRKIASIGVALRGWVTCHGFALNVDLDLAGFESIVPCGLHGVVMTSVQRELGPAAPHDLGPRARHAVAEAFRARFP